MFRKFLPALVFGCFISSSVVMADELRYEVQQRLRCGAFKTKAAFSELKDAQAAMGAGDRLVVASSAYEVRSRSCSRSAWKTIASHSKLAEAQAQVKDLVEVKKTQAHVAEYVISVGCKLPSTFVAYRLEDAKELLAALNGQGRLVNTEKLEITGE